MIDTDRSSRNRARPGVRRALVPGLLALGLAAAQSAPAGPIAAPVAKGTVLVRLETVATGLRHPAKIKIRALLAYGFVFRVAPRVTYNEYAPLGAP